MGHGVLFSSVVHLDIASIFLLKKEHKSCENGVCQEHLVWRTCYNNKYYLSYNRGEVKTNFSPTSFIKLGLSPGSKSGNSTVTGSVL